ncbi:MAG: hypothetical protein H0W29_07045 [Gemmatimonadales bacterium]|nr:hypothetical protein [Gemmatimonadales bacterium]
MPLKLPAGVVLTPAPPRQAPLPFDVADGLTGGPVVVPGYGRDRGSTYHTERAAVAELRRLAAEALACRGAGDRLAPKLAALPDHPKAALARERLAEHRWMEDAAVTLAARIWATLPEGTRVTLAGEGWPGHPGIGWDGCRAVLLGWIDAGEVPHREVPFLALLTIASLLLTGG